MVFILMLLLSVTGALATNPQTGLPPEKKKELRKFDPADFFPEVRGNAENQGRKKRSRNAGRTAVTRNTTPSKMTANPASQSGESSEKGQTITPLNAGNDAEAMANRAAAIAANPDPTPSPVASQSPPPDASLLASTALLAPTQPEITEPKSSAPLLAGSHVPAATFNTTSRPRSLSLHLTILLLGVICSTLFAVIVKLKKDLRKL